MGLVAEVLLPVPPSQCCCCNSSTVCLTLLLPLLLSTSQVAVHFMGSVAEALLQLPEVPLRSAAAADTAAAPAGLWLTAGLLAADGFALQLRLKKTDKVRSQKH